MKTANKNGIYPTVKQSECKYLSKTAFKYYVEEDTHKTQKGLDAYLQQLNEKEEKELNGRKVKTISFQVEWYRNRTWGNCPKMEAWLTFDDGTHEYYNCGATGCGYDKESTCFANVMNKYAKSNLYAKRRNRKKAPYGVRFSDFGPYYEGGVGVSCYYRIAKFLGGKLDHTGWSRISDSYYLTIK